MHIKLYLSVALDLHIVSIIATIPNKAVFTSYIHK